MIDLHTHTNESDGSLSPEELIDAAASTGIRALAITDHDTFSGYERARERADQLDLDLVRGIEVSTRSQNRAIHLLAYFFDTPDPSLENWLEQMRANRQERNRRLADRLAEIGVPVTLEEAESLGRTITGRVHFARVMVQKGFARTIQDAFTRYLGEGAPGYVEVDDPSTVEAIRRVRAAGGLPVIAHPGRYKFRDLARERFWLEQLAQDGLAGLEVIHTDHSAETSSRYLEIAQDLRLLTTGGSDFHGEAKPHVRLGRGGHGESAIPEIWLDNLRAAVRPAS